MQTKPAGSAGGFEVAAKERRVAELTSEMSSPDFWNNRAAADEKIKELGMLGDLVEKYNVVERGIAELVSSSKTGKLDEDRFHEIKHVRIAKRTH